MTMQLDLPMDCYAVGVDSRTRAILDLIAGDPIHERDREAIVEAIRISVRWDGRVCANDWRSRIPAWVYPRVVGATVNALIKAHVLIPSGDWDLSTDAHGRNQGKPTRIYRWHGDR